MFKAVINSEPAYLKDYNQLCHEQSRNAMRLSSCKENNCNASLMVQYNPHLGTFFNPYLYFFGLTSQNIQGHSFGAIEKNTIRHTDF